MDKYIGKRLDGRYEIRELIGVGGMANVYKAYDMMENRPVAVKILRDEYMGNEEFLRRFRNESKAVATLSHPNIVRVYDVSFSQKMHSIIMEFIDGITLKEFIDRQGKLGWKETVHFTVQILRALQHAHDNGIVHRDIKPQNIMLLNDGTIKVTDFGIARFARSNTRTITDRAIGSVHYISPEQAQGGTIDEKTDIYSVGVMMYEMLTGKLPFEAENAVSVALKQIQAVPKTPTSINPEIPEGLEAITMRAMQKDPSRRYQSAAEMLRDIDEFKQNPSISFAYKYLTDPAGGAGGGSRPEEDRTRISNGPSHGAPAPQDEEDDGDEMPPRIPFLSVLTGITAAFVLVSGLFIGTMFYFNNPFEAVPSLETPDLVGKKMNTVKYDPLFTENGIKVVGTPEFNNDYDNDVIFEQEPRAGRAIKPGGTIEVKVSSGPKNLTMPDLSNTESGEAYALLDSKGITKYEETREYSESVAEGNVTRTEPEAGAQVSPDTPVTVYVSIGKENKLLQVPDVVGMPSSEAKRVLENAQLQVGSVTSVRSEDYDRGTVMKQDPAGGTEMPMGSTVNLEVSSGDMDVSKVRIPITLPAFKTDVTVKAILDGVEVASKVLTPGSDTSFDEIYEGADLQELEIRINGQLYMQIQVNFQDAYHYIQKDYSSRFVDGIPTTIDESEDEERDSEEDEDRSSSSENSESSDDPEDFPEPRAMD